MKSRTALAIASLFLGLASLMGCSESGDRSPVESLELAPVSNGVGSPNPDVTEAEALEYAAEWVKAANLGDTVSANRLLAGRAILDRALDPLGLSASAKSRFDSTGPEMIEGLATSISSLVKAGGAYSMVRVLQRGANRHVMLRLELSDGAFNYHDIKLSRRNGRVLGDQVFVAVTGEALSDTLRALISPTIMAQSSLLSRLSDKAKKELKQLKQLQSMAEAVRDGKHETALEIYSEMPRELQRNRVALLCRIRATSIEDEEEYLAALNECAEQFPNDASTAFILLDAALLTEDEALLLRSFETMNTWTGGDPWLNVVIASALVTIGSMERADEIMRAVEIDDLGSLVLHDIAVCVTLEVGNHAATLHHLTKMVDVYEAEFEDLTALNGWDAFMGSPEYVQWSERSK